MSYTRILKKQCREYLDYLILDNQFQKSIRSLPEGGHIEILKDAREYNGKLRRPYKMNFIAKVIRASKIDGGQCMTVLIFAKRFPSVTNSFLFF